MAGDAASYGRATLHRLGGAEGAPDLLLVHGFGADRYAWAATAPAFFDTHVVWAVELPGHTAAPIEAGSGDAESMARAVAQVIEGRLKAPFPVVGHSLGGVVAIELADAFPDLVASVVAIAPAGFGTSPNKTFLDDYPRLETAEEAQRLLELLVTRPRLINPPMVQHVLGFLTQPGRREALEKIAGKIETMLPVSLPVWKQVEAIWGDSDLINPLSAEAAAALPLPVHRLEGAGHLPQVEQARKTNAIIAQVISDGGGTP
jgi:pyruvate dehydrogenase E2 component (dihydrolipoamide acetyltransferase)